ncbi:MAG TPA: efflux RND transporter periplasmic adaptor subunit [Symbiobacteriaceae bacterium]|nr:efflux RND transporter periplasmic adaptor subunit [Symbiobacteriaceae bacterium]
MQFTKAMMAAVLLAMLPLAAGCGLLAKEEEEPAPKLAAPVKSEKQTYTVRRGTIEDKVTLRASWAPVANQDLFFKNGGRVKAVYVTAGARVEAGQVLAELFADDAEYQLAQAQLRLERVKLSVADEQYKLQFDGTPAAESELKRLEIDLKSAQLEVDRYERVLSETRLVAPFTGLLTSVNLRVGDNLAAYTVVMRIEDPADLIIEASVTDGELMRLAAGQRVRLEFDEVTDVTGGTVVQMPDPLVNAQTPGAVTKKIRIEPDGHSRMAKMGMSGKVHVILQEKKDVLLLDTAAIRRFSNRTYVLMQEPRREIDVTVGIEGENITEIVKPLKEGDVVIGR